MVKHIVFILKLKETLSPAEKNRHYEPFQDCHRGSSGHYSLYS